MENQNQSENKLKIDDKEYLIESLPDEAKQLIAGLRTSDVQTNMYQDRISGEDYFNQPQTWRANLALQLNW